MGAGMPDAPPLTPQVVQSDVSVIRLHGMACFDCGAVNRRLRAAGQVVLRGCSLSGSCAHADAGKGQQRGPRRGRPVRPRGPR